jgi:dihydrodipicolinate synthase/N-acetylneuraminate lyase
MSNFSGIWIPLITPFSDGAVDHAALRTLVKIYADAGVAGLVALGTTGEPAAHPRIQAVKDCAGSQEKTLALILDGRLRVLAGDDINILSTLCLGGSGAVAASAHVAPAEYVGVYQIIADRRLAESRTRFHTLAPAITALFSEPNPAPVKAALADMGLIRNELRPPMMPTSAQFCAGWQTLRPSLPPLLRAQFEPGAASASGSLPNSSP